MKYRDHLVPANKRIVSPGTNARTHLTIHETGNVNRGANASAHARLQANGNSRRASWHWQVDDREAVRSYESTAICIHAGNARGSATSVAIEICVNSDGNRAKALANAAELAARICREEGIPLANIVQHHHWSGKDCPTGLRAGQPMGWASFLSMVKTELGATTPPPTPPQGLTVTDVATLRAEQAEAISKVRADTMRLAGTVLAEAKKRDAIIIEWAKDRLNATDADVADLERRLEAVEG